jgi:hypothetical protein
MVDRIMIWHVPTLPAVTPTYYADRDYEPVALRIYAERSPGAGDMLVDILDDGVSIMNSNSFKTVEFRLEDAVIEYGTHSGTFTVGETITGGTSAATARVLTDHAGRLTLINVSTTLFTVGETITGATSSATAVIDAYIRPKQEFIGKTVAGQSHAVLPKGTNSDEAAQDFIPGVDIRQGSWVSLSILDAAGAGNVTVQLELRDLGETH